MNDTPTLVQFKSGWERAGTGSDGLPLYNKKIIIRLDRPPLLSVERTADPADFAEYPMPFQLFQKEEEARKQSYATGYPLSLWPAVNEAEFKMLVDRDITTVEQLAGLHKTRNLPPEIQELAGRAVKLMELSKGAAKYEELLKERDGRIEALQEQVDDARKTIAAQRTEIDMLRIRGIGG
jgi:hypothetical protein